MKQFLGENFFSKTIFFFKKIKFFNERKMGKILKTNQNVLF